MTPCSSQKPSFAVKDFSSVILIYSALLQCFSPSGPTMAYNQCPPSRKSIFLVSARQGLGPHHWSRSSAVVHADQTSWGSASNSRCMAIVLFSLLTLKSNDKLAFIFFMV